MSGLMLLANDPPSMLIPKANPRDNNSIFYHYFYSVNIPNHLLISTNQLANNVLVMPSSPSVSVGRSLADQRIAGLWKEIVSPSQLEKDNF